MGRASRQRTVCAKARGKRAGVTLEALRTIRAVGEESVEGGGAGQGRAEARSEARALLSWKAKPSSSVVSQGWWGASVGSVCFGTSVWMPLWSGWVRGGAAWAGGLGREASLPILPRLCQSCGAALGGARDTPRPSGQGQPRPSREGKLSPSAMASLGRTEAGWQQVTLGLNQRRRTVG